MVVPTPGDVALHPANMIRVAQVIRARALKAEAMYTRRFLSGRCTNLNMPLASAKSYGYENEAFFPATAYTKDLGARVLYKRSFILIATSAGSAHS